MIRDRSIEKVGRKEQRDGGRKKEKKEVRGTILNILGLRSLWDIFCVNPPIGCLEYGARAQEGNPGWS